jgi:integrase
LLALLNAKVRAGAPVAANRLRALVSRIYTFGAEQRQVLATANPVIGVKKPFRETTRDRVLTDDEIRRLWEACATQNPYVCAWFRLRLVTAQRGGELLQMRWQDVDPMSHFWTIPGEFVKNAHGHRVYLNETARKLLKDVPRGNGAVWVFPKSSTGDYKHVGRRLAQSTRANIVAQPKANGTARDRADMRDHDLRRTAASLMASGGVSHRRDDRHLAPVPRMPAVEDLPLLDNVGVLLLGCITNSVHTRASVLARRGRVSKEAA